MREEGKFCGLQRPRSNARWDAGFGWPLSDPETQNQFVEEIYVNEFKEQIEEARAQVARCRIRAERPSARLEEEYALEKARNRLLTLELKELKQAQRARGAEPAGTVRKAGEARRGGTRNETPHFNRGERTKHKQIFVSARQQAETKFAALQEGIKLDKEGS